jgi:quinol monooxygenase YgiN
MSSSGTDTRPSPDPQSRTPLNLTVPVAPLVAATKEEPGALAYEYNVSDDESTIHIFERYRDSNAVVAHVEQTFAQFAERFLALATVTGFVVYGSPNAEARKILDGFGAVYMTPFDGFTR